MEEFEELEKIYRMIETLKDIINILMWTNILTLLIYFKKQ